MAINLFEWIQGQKAQTDYTNWLNDPVTRIMLDGSRSDNYTRPLQTPTGDLALQTLGLNAGRDITVNRQSSLLDEVLPSDIEFDVSRMNNLIADGYSTDEAQGMLKAEEEED
jgi:hypothetical protein